jgi:aspartyl-tRNA(Asn)/glutamyl-tRNA(Gln) amidotransferase subunit A
MTRNTRPINYLGLPALSLPGGFTANGLPWGFQLVGRPFAEKLLFRTGRAYERATEWGSRAPSL